MWHLVQTSFSIPKNLSSMEQDWITFSVRIWTYNMLGPSTIAINPTNAEYRNVLIVQKQNKKWFGIRRTALRDKNFGVTVMTNDGIHPFIVYWSYDCKIPRRSPTVGLQRFHIQPAGSLVGYKNHVKQEPLG